MHGPYLRMGRKRRDAALACDKREPDRHESGRSWHEDDDGRAAATARPIKN